MGRSTRTSSANQGYFHLQLFLFETRTHSRKSSTSLKSESVATKFKFLLIWNLSSRKEIDHSMKIAFHTSNNDNCEHISNPLQSVHTFLMRLKSPQRSILSQELCNKTTMKNKNLTETIKQANLTGALYPSLPRKFRFRLTHRDFQNNYTTFNYYLTYKYPSKTKFKMSHFSFS